MSFTKSVIVKISLEHAYNLWADFESFPEFMDVIKSVTRTGNDTSHWTMKGPWGKEWQWNARTTVLQPYKRITFDSIDGDIKVNGSVTFHEINAENTLITVTMQYEPITGKPIGAESRLFDNSDIRLEEDLRRFKRYAEHTARV